MQTKEDAERKIQQRHEMLKNPAIYRKVAQMAAQLEKSIQPQIDIMVDMVVGDRFKDNETQKTYVYDGITKPIVHSDLMTLVGDMAGKPLEQLSDIAYFLIREETPTGTIILPDVEGVTRTHQTEPLLLVNGRDLVKLFAVGKWEFIHRPQKLNADVFAGEENVLRRLDIHDKPR